MLWLISALDIFLYKTKTLFCRSVDQMDYTKVLLCAAFLVTVVNGEGAESQTRVCKPDIGEYAYKIDHVVKQNHHAKGYHNLDGNHAHKSYKNGEYNSPYEKGNSNGGHGRHHGYGMSNYGGRYNLLGELNGNQKGKESNGAAGYATGDGLSALYKKLSQDSSYKHGSGQSNQKGYAGSYKHGYSLGNNVRNNFNGAKPHLDDLFGNSKETGFGNNGGLNNMNSHINGKYGHSSSNRYDDFKGNHGNYKHSGLKSYGGHGGIGTSSSSSGSSHVGTGPHSHGFGGHKLGFTDSSGSNGGLGLHKDGNSKWYNSEHKSKW